MSGRLICWCATLLLLATPAAAQDFDKGLAAARAGDFATAVAQWRPLAEDGNAEAQFNLGALYESGLGVPKNLGDAAGWYVLAAAQGQVSAQYNLGVMYAEGRGVERDYTRAAEWLRRAAEQGHAKAQYNLAVLYQTGHGVPKDPDVARKWFAKAAASGVSPGSEAHESATVSAVALGPGKSDDDAEAKKTAAQRAADMVPDEPQHQDAEASTAAPIAADRPIQDDTEMAPAEETTVAARQPGLEPAAGPIVTPLPAGPLHIGAKWRAGQRFHLEISETRERKRGGRFVMAQASETTADLVVKAVSDDGALFELTYGAAKTKTAGDANASQLANELGKLIEGQVVAYRTDQTGEVTTLVNPGELVAFYRKAIDKVVNQIGSEGADPQLVGQIRANLDPLLAEDNAATQALELPRLLHFFTGRELEVGKAYHEVGAMRLPPSADALPSTVDYSLKWFDRSAGIAWLRWHESVDPQRTASAMKDYIRKLAAQAEQPVPDDFKLGDVDASDSADYEIDLATGLPRQVIYTRNIKLLGYSQTEKRRIRIVP